MSNQDYLLRMIEQFAVFLGRVIFHRDAGQYEEALKELDLIVKELAGFDPEEFASFGRERLGEILEAEDEADRLELIGRVLAERQRILALRGAESATGELCRDYALRFLLKAEDRGPPAERRLREILELAASCPYAALAELGEDLLGLFERRGIFDKAEDLLFELVRIDRPRFLAAGLAFYERMRGMPDARLAAGALPRAELDEGLRALQGGRQWQEQVPTRDPSSSG